MDAIVKFERGVGNVKMMPMPVPKPGNNQVLIEVDTCGICGTDLHVYHDTFKNYPPVILGHEFAGRVVDRGASIQDTQMGETFAVLGAVARVCGECTYCYQGQFMYCSQRRGMGHGVHGAFAKYAVAREDQLFKVPDGIPLEEAALVEPLAAAVHAVCDIARPRMGDIALVSGPGPIGLLVVKLLVAQGIQVIVAGTQVDQFRLHKANLFGAMQTINIDGEDFIESIHNATQGEGVDLAFEVAGAGSSVNNCLEALRPLGTYIQVGHFGHPLQIAWDHVAFKQLDIRGSLGYTRDTWMRTMKILEHGEINFMELITHRLKLDEWEQGFELMEQKKALKVMLRPE